MGVIVIAAVTILADTDTTNKTQKKKSDAAADAQKKADDWVDQLAKSLERPKAKNNDELVRKLAEQWQDIFAALKRKYGTGRIPCTMFDAARDRYFQDVLLPVYLKYEYNPELSRQAFEEYSDLPTKWTLTGRKRDGCVE